MADESRRSDAGEKTATAPVRGVSTRSPHAGAGSTRRVGGGFRPPHRPEPVSDPVVQLVLDAGPHRTVVGDRAAELRAGHHRDRDRSLGEERDRRGNRARRGRTRRSARRGGAMRWDNLHARPPACHRRRHRTLGAVDPVATRHCRPEDRFGSTSTRTRQHRGATNRRTGSCSRTPGRGRHGFAAWWTSTSRDASRLTVRRPARLFCVR